MFAIRNNKLLVTGATLVVTGALLAVTMTLYRDPVVPSHFLGSVTYWTRRDLAPSASGVEQSSPAEKVRLDPYRNT